MPRIPISILLLVIGLSASVSGQTAHSGYVVIPIGLGNAKTGSAIAQIGDLDNDGRPEIAAGLPLATGGGAVCVLSNLGTTWNASLVGPPQLQTAEEVGRSLATTGDLNGDGMPDLLVGAPRFDGAAGADCGRVYVQSFGGTYATTVIEGESAGENFGAAVASGADFDGDGVFDFIVGAPKHPSGSSLDVGRARVFSGATGALIRVHDGQNASAKLGTSIAVIGDVNADGVGDYVIGAPDDNTQGTQRGAARVYSGATGAVLWSVFGDSNGDRCGNRVAGGADYDGDGTPDFLVAMTSDDVGASNSGTVRVHSGATAAILWTLHGTAANENFGLTLAVAGDMDLDGVPDVIAGSYTAAGEKSGAGWVGVFSGRTHAMIQRYLGEETGDEFGRGVLAIGDIDADGIDNIAIGSPGTTNSYLERAGAVAVFPDRVRVLPDWRYDTRLGLGVGGAVLGDLDGDGAADFGVATFNGVNLAPLDLRIKSGVTGQLIRSEFMPYSSKVAPIAPLRVDRDLDGDGVPEYESVSAATFAVPVAVVEVRSGATGAPLSYLTGLAASTSHLGVGDLNFDGVTDFARLDSVTGWSFQSGATGAIIAARALPSGTSVLDIAALGDVNGDGAADVGTRETTGGVTSFVAYAGATAQVLYTASFGPSVSGAPVVPRAARTVGDFDGDGASEVALIWRESTPGGFFSTVHNIASIRSGANGAQIAFFDETLFINTGPSEAFAEGVETSDLNGDGVPDYLRQDGVYFDGATLALRPSPRAGGIGGTDVNGDGVPDLMVGRSNSVGGNSGPSGVGFWSLGGAVRYGAGLGRDQSIDLSWLATGGVGAGQVRIGNGAPSSTVLLIASEGLYITPVLGVVALIDAFNVTPLVLTVPLDGLGQAVLPVSLAVPAIANENIFLQAFAPGAANASGYFTSNGLSIQFLP